MKNRESYSKGTDTFSEWVSLSHAVRWLHDGAIPHSCSLQSQAKDYPNVQSSNYAQSHATILSAIFSRNVRMRAVLTMHDVEYFSGVRRTEVDKDWQSYLFDQEDKLVRLLRLKGTPIDGVQLKDSSAWDGWTINISHLPDELWQGDLINWNDNKILYADDAYEGLVCPSSYKMGHESVLSIGGSGSFV
jgi:hypothetical protein